MFIEVLKHTCKCRQGCRIILPKFWEVFHDGKEPPAGEDDAVWKQGTLDKSHPVLHLAVGTNNRAHDVNVEEGQSQVLPGALHQSDHHELAALQEVTEALEARIVYSIHRFQY